MLTETLHKKSEGLTASAEAYLDEILRKIPDADEVVRVRHSSSIGYFFRAPCDLTKEEFDSVGRCLTNRMWSWATCEKKGERNWGVVLLPFL